jgi:hypothetical protein
MKIIELINLTETKPLKDIAKDEMKHLTGFEKKMRGLLNEIGCTPKGIGKKGWNYENVDPEALQKDVESFEVFKSRTAKKIKPENKQTRKEENHDIILLDSNPSNLLDSNPSNKKIEKEGEKKVKKVTYEIDENLHLEIRMRAIKQKKNVSELVEQAMKEFLNK